MYPLDRRRHRDLVAVGKSDALTAKLRDLEKQKRALAQKVPSAVPSMLLTGAADQWRELVGNLERLNRYATPDEMEAARVMLRDYIGEIAVTEEAGGVFAYTKLSNGAGYKSGAEERT